MIEYAHGVFESPFDSQMTRLTLARRDRNPFQSMINKKHIDGPYMDVEVGLQFSNLIAVAERELDLIYSPLDWTWF
ncbi:hypothetical protein ANO14919_125990 [Xylariales sp. No.14919]|nr:hypothetical protein ANO14919_125990 [Xylariales sp. No.14919]